MLVDSQTCSNYLRKKSNGKMSNNLTRREIFFLIVLGAMAFLLVVLETFTSFEMTEGWEVFFLVFIGFPLGLFVAFDPERLKSKDKVKHKNGV